MSVRDAFELHRWRLRPFIAAEDTAAAERGSDLWCETIGTGEVGTLAWSPAHTPAVMAAYRRFLAQAEGGFGEGERYLAQLASPMPVDAQLVPPRYRCSRCSRRSRHTSRSAAGSATRAWRGRTRSGSSTARST